MARFGKTEINLSDTIQTLVTGLNTVSDDVGNVDNLAGTVASDSNLVDAINTLATTTSGVDSAASIATIRADFSTNGGVTIVNQTTVRQLTGDSASFSALSADSATINQLTVDSADIIQMKMDGIGNLAHLKPLQIKNASGTVVLAGYLLSTSNSNSTL